jgi:CDP-diacylglycerol--serine O-phosphatidyltransferase
MTANAAPIRRAKRGAYLLPSLLTTANLFLGFYALIQAVRGHVLGVAGAAYFDSSAKAIGWAILFDGWDGRVARILNATSDFGRELDSLADCVTFGLAPAFLAYAWGIAAVDPATAGILRPHFDSWGLGICFIFLTCGAARLARFNISTNPIPANPGKPGRKYFVGLAIPAGAGVIAGIVHFQNGQVNQWTGWPVMWLAIVLGTALLMVSNWRYYSFKEIRLGRGSRANVIWIAILLVAIYNASEVVLLLIAVVYTLSGVVFRIGSMLRRKPPQLPPAVENA